MIFKYCSAKEIISRVYRDLNLQEEARWLDMIEWIGEGLEYIGTTVQYQKKFKEMEIVNHRVFLPCDLVHIDQVTHNKIAMVQTNSTVLSRKTEVDKTNSGDKQMVHRDSFTIQGDCIITGFKEGTINVYYIGIALDDEGFPLVPDTPRYKDALFHYIVYKLKLGGGVSGTVPLQELDYWTRLKINKMAAARAELAMPTISEQEAMGRKNLRLVMDMHSFDKLFVSDDLRQKSI